MFYNVNITLVSLSFLSNIYGQLLSYMEIWISEAGLLFWTICGLDFGHFRHLINIISLQLEEI